MSMSFVAVLHIAAAINFALLLFSNLAESVRWFQCYLEGCLLVGLSPEEDFSVSLINCQHPTDRNFNVRSWNTLPSSSRQDACLTSDATRQDTKLREATAASLMKAFLEFCCGTEHGTRKHKSI